MKVEKSKRYGFAYKDKPWVVTIGRGTEKKIHRFKTEQEADEFMEGRDGDTAL